MSNARVDIGAGGMCDCCLSGTLKLDDDVLQSYLTGGNLAEVLQDAVDELWSAGYTVHNGWQYDPAGYLSAKIHARDYDE